MAKKTDTKKAPPKPKAKADTAKPAAKAGAKAPAAKAKGGATKAVAKGKGGAKGAAEAKPLTKNGLITLLAEKTTLEKKKVGEFLDALGGVIEDQLVKGPGKISLPFGVKLERKEQPAKPAREVINPKTKEKIPKPAEPAKTVIKARALKSLRELAQK